MVTKFAIVTAIIAALCGVWRIEQFGYLEMQGDQAFFTQWVLRLADADHFFPKGVDGQGMLDALMHDEDSFLNILMRQIYQAQTLLFIVVSTIFFTLALLVTGITMQGVVVTSVAASVIGLWFLALFPVKCRTDPPGGAPTIDMYAIGMLALVGGVASSFLNIFSAMGPHNTGVMFFLMAALVTQRWLGRVSQTGMVFADKQATVLMFVVQWLAIYAHYTNIFIIGPATVLAIAMDPLLRPRRRLGIVLEYSGISLVAFIPALAQLVVYNNTLSGLVNSQTYAGIAADFILSSGNTAMDTIGERAFLWFGDVSRIYTVPGFLLGLVGVAGMAWRDRIILPAAIVGAHFLFGSLMLSFGQYDRTAAYLVPMLILGGAWTVVAAVRYMIDMRHAGWRRSVTAGLLVILVFTATSRHVVSEYARIKDPSKVVRWGVFPGEAVWRPVISQVEVLIPVRGVLIPWDYGLSNQFRSMSQRSRRDLRVLRPLETLFLHLQTGTLRDYLDVRGQTMSAVYPTFILVPGDMTPENLNGKLRSVFGRDGFSVLGTPTIIPRLSWKLRSYKDGTTALRLFEVIFRP